MARDRLGVEMSHHYINPADEYRDCKGCCVGTVQPGTIHSFKCYQCKGTGKLGDKDAKPEIEVWEYFMEGKSIGYFWNESGTDGMCGKPHGINSISAFGSEAEALEAAREALK